MLRIELLPAEFGDAIWIEYGKAAAPHRILVDCGTGPVYPRIRDRILALPGRAKHFELLVVTHVDADHIGGAIELLRDQTRLGVTFGEIWFNGYVHLTAGGGLAAPDAAEDILGPVQGETLTKLIVANGVDKWNATTKGRALVVPESGPLDSLPLLPGGMRLTLLSPTQGELDRLKPVWEAACRKAGIAPGAATSADSTALDEVEELADDDILGEPDIASLATTGFKPDRAKPNGTSIALLAEYDGKSLLLAGDAYAPVLVDALSRLSGNAGGRVGMDVVKLSHHGSRGNTSTELVRAVKCEHWLVSTNGKQFKHPDQEAIARVIHHGGPGTLHFNYRTEFNDMWARLAPKHGFKARYPSTGDGGIALDLSP